MVSGNRVKELTVTRPFMYGNLTVPLEMKDRRRDTPPDHTHKWTVFVRDPAGKDDMSYFIKKVVFKLHDTYNMPQRTIESPPFEVTETGWGEFEIQIRIFFASVASEKQIVLHHHLKLHPYGPEFEANPPALLPSGIPVPRPVESIIYDEFVFSEPTEGMLELLTSRPGALLLKYPKPQEKLPFSYQTEAEEMYRVAQASDAILDQINATKAKIEELEKTKRELEEQA